MTESTTIHVHPMTPEGAVDLIHKLIRERDHARQIAAMLENECANCWGPVHSMAINEARLQAQYPYPTSKAADDGA